MALDKNDGTFKPSIEGVISGKTSQVDGMNGLLNDLIGNDNYLKDKKLDRGNYTGTAEKLNNGVNSAWGGEYAGDIQDSIIKEVGKHYRDRINGKGYRCIKSGGSNITTNTTEYFEPCNVVDNLDKLQNLYPNIYLIQLTGDGVSGDCPLKIIYNSYYATWQIDGGTSFSLSKNSGVFSQILPQDIRPLLRSGVDIVDKSNQKETVNINILDNGTISWNKPTNDTIVFRTGFIVTSSYFLKN